MHRYLIPPDEKHRTYRGRYRVGDNLKIHEVSLKTTVKEVAEKLLKEAYEDAQRESVGLIPPAATRKAKRRALAELFEEYLAFVRKNGRSNDHVRVMKLRFLALAKGCRWGCMEDVTARSFIDWRDAQTDYQPRTLNNFFEAARAFFNWVDRNYEIPNPLKRVETLDVPARYPQGPRSFTEAELEKLFAIAKPKRRFFYRLMAFTGLRRKEAQRLCWGDIQLEEQPGLYLRAEATKSRRADWLPLLSVLVPEITAARPAHWKPTTKVFLRGVPDPDTLHRDMGKAGIPLVDQLGRPTGIHTFRRTFITLLQKRGVHPRVIMQLARHKSLRLTNWTYTDTTMLPLVENVEKLAAVAGSPRSSPLFFGPKGDFVANSVQAGKVTAKEIDAELPDSDEPWDPLANDDQSSPELVLVPEEGVEPTRL